METADFLVIGGGVIGLNIARTLRRRHPDSSITLLEKEPQCGLHASGRNSGVIHAGFYYSADSLKARFTREGNQRMLAYCDSRKIPVNRCGKLVVARNADDLPRLDELLRRGKVNGVPLDSITEDEARKIEPRVKTWQRAIFSPATATADPMRVISAMRDDAISEGVRIKQGVTYIGRRASHVTTSEGDFSAGYLINAAGLYADQVALDFDFSQNYRILPFKGLYLYSDEPSGAFKTNIYPVPDLRNPFLGVHFTLVADGHAKIGPTAIPAFWREQYTALGNFKLSEFAQILWRDLGLIAFAGFDFKRLAFEELQKYSRSRMVSLASDLASDVKVENYRRWGKPGIRAQLMNITNRKLEMDFVIEGDDKSLHVLNAVSPAWTCSLPFSEYVCDRIAELIK
jgi:L-2-hydroxyglutarate oxidase LhgO